jgi:hypothetical protein
LDSQTIRLIIIVAYFLIGIWSFAWIRRDAEFRTGPWLIMAILSIGLWPVMVPAWMLIRGREHLTDLAAKQSHRDYQIYMRGKKDKDLFTHFKPNKAKGRKATGSTAQASQDAGALEGEMGAAFQDYNIEDLIQKGKWDEAMAAAAQMRKVAGQMGENDRAARYDEYIQRIEEARRMDME